MTVSKKDFKQHMKFHRTGPELKLFCEHCSFVTDCESRLRRHSYIHSKEKPFKCGMCEYRASQKEHVVRHMRSQHGIEIERKSRRNEEEDSLDGLLFFGFCRNQISNSQYILDSLVTF
jgi:KRAB domain-containing zinc finger protein